MSGVSSECVRRVCRSGAKMVQYMDRTLLREPSSHTPLYDSPGDELVPTSGCDENEVLVLQ